MPQSAQRIKRPLSFLSILYCLSEVNNNRPQKSKALIPTRKILMAKGFIKLFSVKYFTVLRLMAKKILAANIPRCAFVLVYNAVPLFSYKCTGNTNNIILDPFNRCSLFFSFTVTIFTKCNRQ